MAILLTVGIAAVSIWITHLVWRLWTTRVPNAHFSSAVSGLWMWYKARREQQNLAIYLAHQRLGPLVRLGPNEVSVNAISQGLDLIYAGNFDKGGFYSKMANFDQQNMFSELTRAPHLERRKILSGVYSKSSIMTSADFCKILQTVVFEKVTARIDEACAADCALEIMETGNAAAMDSTSAFVFGLGHGTRFLDDPKANREWMDLDIVDPDPWWMSILPRDTMNAICKTLQVPLPASSMPDDGEDQVDLALGLCEAASGRSTSQQGVVYSRLRAALANSGEDVQPEIDAKMASETADHLIAGTDTTAVTLVYLFYELSQRPELQQRLRSELPSYTPEGVTPTYLKTIDRIPLLDAIINETLRVHPPVPGRQPRIVPSSGAMIAGHFVPGGTKISASAYTLHRNAEVFHDPERWDHERWLRASAEERTQMDRWFWAFGSGVRMCIGKAVAMIELKCWFAAVYARWETEVVGDVDVKQGDGYAAGPKGRKLMVRFRRVDGVKQ